MLFHNTFAAFLEFLNMRPCSSLMGVSLLALLTAMPALAAAPQPEGEVEELVVTGAPYAVSLDTVTTSLSIVTREDLDVAPPSGLGDLLSGQPGLRSTAYGPGASRPVIRGLAGPRVLVLQNGVGLVDASALSPDHAVASEPGEASRIEVLRGPSTLAYGGSGIGGVVNIIDDRIPSRRPEAPLEGRIAVSASSVDSGQSINGGLKVAVGPLVFALDAVRRTSEDYEVPVAPVSKRLASAEGLTIDPTTTVRNADVSLDAYGAGVAYVGEDGYLGLSVKQTDTRYGVPRAQIFAPIDPGDEGPVAIDLTQTRYDLRGEAGIDFGPFERIRTSIGYADYEHAELVLDVGEIGTRFLSNGVEGRLELVQKETDHWKGAIGLQALTRDFEAIGDEAFVPGTTVSELGLFTLQRLDLGGWGFDGGLRVDQRKIEADLKGRAASPPAASYGLDWTAAPDHLDFTNVSASLGLFWEPADGHFYALTLASNSRAPTEAELFADGSHPGTGGYELGDPDLDSETVISLEATGRWSFGAFEAEAHVWSASYDGFIEQAPDGQVEDGLKVFRYFQTGADFHGFEAEGSYDLWADDGRSLTFEAAADYVHGDTDAGAPARIPPWSVTTRLVWKGERLETRLELRRVGQQHRVSTFELPTDGYTVANLYADFKPFGDPALRLFVEGRNLTDAEIREHASFLKDVAPAAGRSVRTGLAWRF